MDPSNPNPPTTAPPAVDNGRTKTTKSIRDAKRHAQIQLRNQQQPQQQVPSEASSSTLRSAPRRPHKQKSTQQPAMSETLPGGPTPEDPVAVAPVVEETKIPTVSDLAVVKRSVKVAPIAPVTIQRPKKPTQSIHGDENMKAIGTRWSCLEVAERNRTTPPLTTDPEEARRLIAKGIQNIKNKRIDEHGYRQLQGLIYYHDQLFHDEQLFDDMLLALLDALESSNHEVRKPLGPKSDFKFRVLVIIRMMNLHNRKYYAAYFPRIMTAVITARKQFDAKSHLVCGLELTAQDIIASCSPPDVIDAMLDVLEYVEAEGDDARTLCMGLFILGALAERMRMQNTPLTSQRELRMAKLGLHCLMQPNTDVRIAVVAFCIELNELIEPSERFFDLVCESNHELRALLTYYIKKNRP